MDVNICSNICICCVINMCYFLAKHFLRSLYSLSFSFPLSTFHCLMHTAIAFIALQLQPSQHLNDLQLRQWWCPWMHAGGTPTMLNMSLVKHIYNSHHNDLCVPLQLCIAIVDNCIQYFKWHHIMLLRIVSGCACSCIPQCNSPWWIQL